MNSFASYEDAQKMVDDTLVQDIVQAVRRTYNSDNFWNRDHVLGRLHRILPMPHDKVRGSIYNTVKLRWRRSPDLDLWSSILACVVAMNPWQIWDITSSNIQHYACIFEHDVLNLTIQDNVVSCYITRDVAWVHGLDRDKLRAWHAYWKLG